MVWGMGSVFIVWIEMMEWDIHAHTPTAAPGKQVVA